ncbi:MAG: histidine kinase [Gammaproteobacteria bacterium]|nr:histidine kinase [Gammaproteobacteria bacterium]
MILIVETIVVLFSAVHAAYVPFFPALAFLTVYYQMVLILVAGLVCHLSGVLARWHVATATLAVVVITSAAAAVVALALQEWALGHTSTFALFIGQTQLSCLALALFFLRYRYLQQQRYEQLRAQINARLEALQAYIRPHFLFNSLNNLAAMITIDAAKAEQLVLAMAYMLRYVLRASAVVSLGDEMEFLRRYVFIEQARLGDRLRMQWRLPESLDESSTLPSMIIQPLLENAINHGPGALSDGGRVEVEFVQTTQHTAVYIRNHAPVADAATTAGARRRPGATTASAEHHQLSIANIRARLQLLYDNQAQLVCQAGASIDEERLWWQTELTIPRRQPSPTAINGEPNRPAPNPSP